MESSAEPKNLLAKFTPPQLVHAMGFDGSLQIAKVLINDSEWNEDTQLYAMAILEEVQRCYPEKWNSSWRYDAFLGYVYDIVWKFDERYAAFKRAIINTEPPPPQLLVAMARCCSAPGNPPITEEEAISLVKQAVTITPYIEAVALLRGLYKSVGNTGEEKHWDRILTKIEHSGTHLPSLDQL